MEHDKECFSAVSRPVQTHDCFVPKEENGLLQKAHNFKLYLLKPHTPALKAENCNSQQRELHFPVFAPMPETNYFAIRGFQSLLLLIKPTK